MAIRPDKRKCEFDSTRDESWGGGPFACRTVILTVTLTVIVQLAAALCVHWAVQSGVTPREPIRVIHYTHAGCEDRPAITEPFGDRSPEEHTLTPGGRDTPVWRAPRTPNTP